MNQACKVCGEPAAGFHFGAFTCEGCKSFFGRSCNNLSIAECKNGGQCIINKKNRTACKSCRFRKCLLVGMSKSGSRYGRRSNWFKIHCLLQEQSNNNNNNNNSELRLYDNLKAQNTRYLPTMRKTSDEGDYKISPSPSISSPESDSSTEMNERMPPFMPFFPPSLLQSPPFAAAAAAAAAAIAAQNNILLPTPALLFRGNDDTGGEICNKRIYLDAILQSQQHQDQDNPIDLSMKRTNECKNKSDTAKGKPLDLTTSPA